jgi:hypothetical protein
MLAFGFGFLADEEYRKSNAMSSFFCLKHPQNGAAAFMGRSTAPLPFGQFACGDHGLRSAPHKSPQEHLGASRGHSLSQVHANQPGTGTVLQLVYESGVHASRSDG